MKKIFLLVAPICFALLIIFNSQPLVNAPQQDLYCINEAQAKDKSETLSTNKQQSETKTDTVVNTNENTKTHQAEETNVTAEEEVAFVKGEGNVLISFNANAKNVDFAGRFRLTAYCSCEECCDEYGVDRPIDKNGDIIVETASGTRALVNRTIAVDPRIIPYGTTVIIEQDGVFYQYVAEDCGGAIKNKRIDVYFDSHQTACDFGVKYAKVYLIKD